MYKNSFNFYCFNVSDTIYLENLFKIVITKLYKVPIGLKRKLIMLKFKSRHAGEILI